MERYVMKDLEKIVKYWANRGYVNLLIDTHKVSANSIDWDMLVTIVGQLSEHIAEKK